MANNTLQHNIIIEKENQKNDIEKSYNSRVITALLTFERGEIMKGRLTFDLGSNNNDHVFDLKQRRIKALHIEFV
jgi:hypothetical protein